MIRSAWDEVVGQQNAVDLLRSACASGRAAHAYLFVGPPGAGKATAARALGCALFCQDAGCGRCEACVRIRRGTHPDFHWITPEGAAGYLAEQVRDIVRDVSLSPVEGPHKVYVLENADVFGESAANALLKTLEEPPADVVFVLLAHSLRVVPATIRSRCQVVRFRRLPPSESERLLSSQTGAAGAEAAAALAAAGGIVARAREYLASPPRQQARDTILRTLKDLAAMDALDVLEAAKELLVAVRAPLEEVKLAQAAERGERAEFLSSSASKGLEDRHKRELTAREREGIA